MLVCGIEWFCLHNMQRAVCGRRCWKLLYSERSYGSWFSYEPSKKLGFLFSQTPSLLPLLTVKTFDKRSSVDINFSRGLKMKIKNNLKEIREAKMLGKTELAKLAGVSPLTIDRIERGMPCRIKSQRQIVLALGLKVSERRTVFHDN